MSRYAPNRDRYSSRKGTILNTKPESFDVAGERPRRVIKRYSNRKLYDMHESKYVTLLQIADMVRGGEEVQIIDNTTKDDLTEVTLAQIIFEEQKAQTRNVPLQTLKALIHQRTERVLADLRETPIGRLIPGAVKGAEEVADGATRSPESVARIEKAQIRLVDQAKETLEDWQHRLDERVGAILPRVRRWQDLEQEIAQLASRVEQLEQKLESAKISGDKAE